MPSITVRFYSLWRSHLGTETATLQAVDLDDALSQIEEKFASQLREKLKTSGVDLGGELQDNTLILLNGISLRNLGSAELQDGDILHVFPRAIGG